MKRGVRKVKQLLKRAHYVQTFVKSNASKGIPTAHSVRILAHRVLFVSEKTVYNDLSRDLEGYEPENNESS